MQNRFLVTLGEYLVLFQIRRVLCPWSHHLHQMSLLHLDPSYQFLHYLRFFCYSMNFHRERGLGEYLQDDGVQLVVRNVNGDLMLLGQDELKPMDGGDEDDAPWLWLLQQMHNPYLREDHIFDRLELRHPHCVASC